MRHGRTDGSDCTSETTRLANEKGGGKPIGRPLSAAKGNIMDEFDVRVCEEPDSFGMALPAEPVVVGGLCGGLESSSELSSGSVILNGFGVIT